MKNTVLLFLLFFTIFSFAQDSLEYGDDATENVIPYPETRDGERIINFDANITIAKNADITVKETIKVFATGSRIKRGIFRALPMLRIINGKKEKITYDIISIKKDGIFEPYKVEIMNEVYNIYIGSENVMLDNGIYTYEIVYKTQDQIGHFKDYDEFYWNVNGTDWQFPVEKISAKIILPDGILVLQNSCYEGKYGSTGKNCSVENASPTITIFTAENLEAKENLTVAIGFKAGMLEESSSLMKFLKQNWPSLLLFFGFLYLLYFYYINWQKYGKDPQKPIVIPKFSPPNDLSPASLDYIINRKFDVLQVTANFVDLATKGFITIDAAENKDNKSTFAQTYTLKKLSKNVDSLQEDEQELVEKLFRSGKKFIITGNYSIRLRDAVNDFNATLNKINSGFIKNQANFLIVRKAFYSIIAIFFAGLALSGVLFLNDSGYKTSSHLFGLLIILIVFFRYLYKNDYNILLVMLGIFALPGMLALLIFTFIQLQYVSFFEIQCYIFLGIMLLTLIPFRNLINKPSIANINMLAEIEGFKLYLSTAEEHLIKFHNPPEMTSALYEKYLPYAMVFGVEGLWGKKFRNIINETLNAKRLILEEQFSRSFANTFSYSVQSAMVEPARKYSSSSSSSSSSSNSSSSSRSSSSSSYSGGSSSSGSSGSGSSGGGGGGGGGGGW